MRKTFILMTLLLPTIGCIPTFVTLSDPEKAQPDEDLYGHWTSERVVEPMKNANALTIEKLSERERKVLPPGFMKLTLWNHKPGEAKKKVLQTFFFVSQIGNQKYATVLMHPNDNLTVSPTASDKMLKEQQEQIQAILQKPQGATLLLIVFRYTVDKSTLRIYGLDYGKNVHATSHKARMQQLQKDAQAKKIRIDHIYKESNGLADTRENVRKYLQANGEELFKSKVVFKRRTSDG